MTIAESVWIAVALLHQQNARAEDFSVQEIIERAVRENLVNGFRPGLQVHISKHCVANKSPNPGACRFLLETTRGRRRLFKIGDPFHPDRTNGKVKPDRREIPSQYQALLDWYDDVYSKTSPHSSTTAPLAATFPARPAEFSENPIASGMPHRIFVGPGSTLTLPGSLAQQFGIREGTCLNVYAEPDRLVLEPITEAFIQSLMGCYKPKDGEESLVEARERDHRIEKGRMAR